MFIVLLGNILNVSGKHAQVVLFRPDTKVYILAAGKQTVYFNSLEYTRNVKQVTFSQRTITKLLHCAFML